MFEFLTRLNPEPSPMSRAEAAALLAERQRFRAMLAEVARRAR